MKNKLLLKKSTSLLFWSFALLFLLVSNKSFGQITEGFESGLPTSYDTALTNRTLGSGTWRVLQAIVGTTGVNSGTKSAQLQSATGSQLITPALTGGVGTISFYVTASTISGGYQVNLSTDGGTTWTAATGSPFTIGITKTLRTITVNNSAVNKIQIYRTGATIYVDDFSTTLPSLTAPGAPTISSITPGNGQLSVAFTAPSSNGGSAITDYKYSVNGGTTYVAAGSTTSPLVISGLSNGTTYTVLLKAVNSVGDGTASASVNGTPRTTPSAPAISSITAGNAQLSVAFTAGSNGGSAITNYKYSSNGGTTFTACSPVQTTSPIVITGLVNGTPYTVQLLAVNAAGDGTASSSTSATPFTTPSAPSITSITSGNSQLSIAFTAGATGGSAITTYEYSLNGGSTFTSAGTTSSPIVVTGLVNGTTYAVQIRAVNSAGNGSATASTNASPSTTADAPTITSITAGNAQLSVAFTAPSFNGGSVITNYKYSLNGGTTFTSAGTTSSPIIVSGLTNGTTYDVQLLAFNAAGDGTASTTVQGTPVAPSNPTISANKITLNALSTVYGTASTTDSFTVSGAALTDDITITAPAGFEVSITSASSGFAAAQVIPQASGSVTSITVYVRLAATITVAGSPYSGDVVISSTGATPLTVATASSTVAVKALTISGITGNDKTYNALATATITGTPSLNGVVGSDTVSVSGSPSFSFSDANAGSNKPITVLGYTLNGTAAGNYSVSQPTYLTATINKANQTLVAISVAETRTFGDATYSVATTSDSGLTVTYASTNTAVATVAASGVVTIIGAGTVTITASQAGNANYNEATNVDQVVTVNKADQTLIAITATVTKVFGDIAYSASTSSTSGLIVSYSSSDTSVATIASNGLVTIVGFGATTITASQSGNTNYNPAISVSQELTVAKANQTITLAATDTKTTNVTTYTLTLNASSGLAIAYTSSNPAVATIAGNTVTIVGAGTTTITANQSGNTNYNAAAESTQVLTVTQGVIILAGWDFFGQSSPTTFAATTYNSNLNNTSSHSTITRGSTAATSSGGNSFRTVGFQNNGISTSNTDYFEVKATPVTGKTLTLTRIDANLIGTTAFYATPGVTSQFAYSLNGTNFTLIGSPVTTTSLAINFDLSSVTALQNVPSGTTVTLRYYASGQTTTGGWGFSSPTSGTNGLALTGYIQSLPAPSITSSLTATGTVGAAFAYAMTATNSPSSYSATGLPSGLSINTTTGAISGSPTAAGTFNVSLSATNGTGTDTKTLVITVAQANQVITFNTLSGKTYGDASFSLNGTSTSGLALTYSSSNTAVATISGNTVTIVGAGTTSITASQSGNDNYFAASNVTRDLVVNKANQIITFAALVDKNDVDGSFTLGATASAGLTVSYVSSNTNVVTISGSTATIVAPGVATITASQPGNDNYNAATSVDQSQTIINTSLANQTITFGALSPVTYGDGSFALNGSVDSSLAIMYTSSNPSVASVSGNIVTVLAAGTTTITASQAGDGTHNPAPNVLQSLVVNKKALTVSNVVVANKDYDGTLTATLTSADLNGVIGTDFVTLSNAAVFASANAGTAIAVTANFSLNGTDANRYLLTQPTGLSADINKANQVITFNALTNKVFGDAPFALTASGGASGTAIVYASNNVSVATISGNTVTLVGAGTTTITASQAGTSNYNAAADVTQTLTVTLPACATTSGTTSWTFATASPSTTQSNITVSTISRANDVAPGTVTTLITSTSASSGYSGSSGTNNAGLAAVAGVLDPNTSSYFAFTVTPSVGYNFTINEISFGSRVTSSGPLAYSLRSSVDNYATALATGTLNNDSVWRLLTNTGLSATGQGNPVTFRLYGHNSTANPGTASNWRIDDLVLNVGLSNVPSEATVGTAQSVCGLTTTALGGNTPSIGTGTWSQVSGPGTSTFSAVNSGSSTTTASAYGTYVYRWSINSGCATTNTADVTIEFKTPITAASTSDGDTSFCEGGSVILTASSGVSYLWSDGAATQSITATTSGSYSVTTTNANGCSATSAATLVTVTPNTSNTTTVSVCDTYTWSVNGQTYSTSGTYTSVSGCHTQILVLTITPSTISPAVIVSVCDTYTWSFNGQTYTTSGDYTSTINCTTTTLHLTITPSTSNTTTASACDTYTWSVNSQAYTASGTYTVVTGCHTEVLHLTITPSTSNTTTASACDTYTWSVNSQAYTASGTYTVVTGCDTKILNLTITPSTTGTTTASACDTYIWTAGNGNTYTASGTYTYVTGCYTQTLVLTITPSTSNTTTASACDTYTWSVNSQAYSASGTYTVVTGCDTKILNLTITPSTTGTTTASACDTYTWSVNSQAYTASGTYTVVTGCHTEVLNLTITPSTAEGNESQSVCGTSYTWPTSGATYTSSGTYTYISGCKTATLTLTLTPSTTHTTVATACDSYEWNGTTYTTSGIKTGTTANCVTELLDLTINQSVVYYADTDGDGFGDSSVTANACSLPAGYSENSTDCDDTNASVNPSATEVANGIDDNCDGSIDEGLTPASPEVTNLTVCVGSPSVTLTATALSGYTLRWYAAATGGTALTATPVVATTAAVVKSFWVSQRLGTGPESARTQITVTVVALPATPGTITGTAAICSVVGSSTELTYFIAPVAGATSYVWTAPLGGSIASGQDTTSVSVNFSGVAQGITALTLGVRSVNASGCLSVAKTLPLTRVLPVAPASVTLTNPASVTPATAITAVGPFIGTTTELTLTAAETASANSYSWTLPVGVNVVSGNPATDRVLVINFANAASGTTSITASVVSVSGCGNSIAKALVLTKALPATPGAITTTQANVCLIAGSSTNVTYTVAPVVGAFANGYTWTVPLGATIVGSATGNSIEVAYSTNFVAAGSVTVTSSNGVGTSATAATLAVAATAPAVPATLVMTNPTSATPTTAVVAAGPFMGTSTELTLTAATVTGAVSYIWNLPFGVNKVSGDTSNVITVNFAGVVTPTGIAPLVISVQAVNGCDLSSVAKALSLTRALPPKPGVIATTNTNVCAIAGSESTVTYTVAPVVGAFANGYNWTVPTGALIVSGEGSTAIVVSYTTSFVAGNVSVTASNGVGISLPATLAVAATAPVVPATLVMTLPPSTTAVVAAGPYMATSTELTLTAASVAGAVSYAWTLPAGVNQVSGGTSNIITVNFADVETPTGVTALVISVKAVNGCGLQSAVKALSLTRVLPAKPGVIATTNTNVCAIAGSSSTVTYTIAPVVGAFANGYTWTVPLGATIVSGEGSTAIVVSYSTSFVAGNVSVTASNGVGISLPATLAVAATAPAVPATLVMTNPASATPTTAVVAAGPFMGTSTELTLTAASVAGAVSYAWTLPAGVNKVSGGTSNVITVNFANVATPTGTAALAIGVKAVNGCGLQSAAKVLSLTRALPATPGKITTSQTNICSIAGTSATATYSVVPVSGAFANGYTWTVPTGATIVSGQGSTSISVSYASDFTAGNITVTSSNGVGTSLTAATLAVARTAAVVTPATIVGQVAGICAGVEYGYTFLAGANAQTYTITGPVGSVVTSADNASNTTSNVITTSNLAFTVVYPSSAIANISIVASNACGSSLPKTYVVSKVMGAITTISGPSAVATCSQYTYTATPVVGAVSYTWTVPAGAQLVSGQGTNTVVVTFTGTLATGAVLKVIATNGCSVSSASKSSSALTRVDCPNAKQEVVSSVPFEVKAYPNPYTESFNLSLATSSEERVGIVVYDMTGRLIEQRDVNTSDVSALQVGDRYPSGVYNIVVTQGEAVKTLRVIKR